LQPNVPVYWYSLGLAYGRLRLLDKALRAYEQAVALKPDYCEPLARLGGFYVLQGERAKVLDIYKKLRVSNCEKADEFFRLFVLPSGNQK
jgi:tetratricopeptide (TPR) repeat protein